MDGREERKLTSRHGENTSYPVFWLLKLVPYPARAFDSSQLGSCQGLALNNLVAMPIYLSRAHDNLDPLAYLLLRIFSPSSTSNLLGSISVYPLRSALLPLVALDNILHQ